MLAPANSSEPPPLWPHKASTDVIANNGHVGIDIFHGHYKSSFIEHSPDSLGSGSAARGGAGEWRRKHLETAGDASLWMSCFDKSPDEDKDIDHGPPESQVLHCALTI